MDTSDHAQNDLYKGVPDGDHEPTHANGGLGGDRWLRSVLENSPEIVKVVDPDGTLRYASPAFGRVFGYDPEEAAGTINVLDLVHPDDLPHVLAETEKALAEGRAVSNTAEYRFRHADGSWRWIESFGSYLLDDPHVRGVVISSRDVTRRKRAEEALRESERRLASVVSNAHAYAYRCLNEPGWPNEYASDYALELTGYPPEDLLVGGKVQLSDLIVEEDRDRVWDEVQGAIAEGRGFELAYALRHRDGRIRHVHEYGRAVYGEDGEVEALEGLVYDVTERREAEVALGEAEERYRTLVERTPAIIYIERPREGETAAYDTTYISPRAEEVLGYPPQRFTEDPSLWDRVIHPEDLDAVRKEDERTDEMGEPFSMEYRVIDKDGRTLWIHDEATLVRNHAGADPYWFGVRTDITERKETEERLSEAEERYRTLVERMPAVTYVEEVGETHSTLYMSPQIEPLLGYPQEAWMGGVDHWKRCLHPEDRERVLEEYARSDETGEPFRTEYRMLHRDGGAVWVHDEAVLVEGPRGRSRFWQGVLTDVTERRVLEERLEHQALHDPLTRLPNRRLFADRLAHALEGTRRRGRGVAVLFMDLDDFKVVNDSLGHEVGDLLLTVVAQRLERLLRPEDTLARFGGDEFVVLLESAENPGEGVRVAQRITDELKRPFALEGRELYVSASVGISFGTVRTKSPADLLRDADTAMYRAKEGGGGFRVFDQAMYERVARRLDLENDLRRAIEQGEFVLHYQPIFDFGSQRIWGTEALVRWDHPKRGLLGPDEFVTVAEETGLIIPIGCWALEEACRRTKEWQDGNPHTRHLRVIVNLSAKQLRHPGCEETIRRALTRSGLSAESLGLDVTETAFIDALEGNWLALERIRTMGVRISIDDFGMGYSSLSYLKRLPADTLKIDKSFLSGFGEKAEDTAIVRMVIDVGHTLGMEVVAEGVEKWAQAALLAETGCDMAQGYHFSEPLVAEDVPGFLGMYTV